MRKLLVLMLAAAALAVPAATAAPMKGNPGHGNGHGKPATKPCHGKAKVMVVLSGTLANQPVAGDTSLQLTVLHSNRWGRGYKKGTQPAPVTVSDSTKYVKNDQLTTIDQLTQNDTLVVKGKLSRCLLRDADPANMPELTAKMVVDQGASS
jgi:hypothetical protein